MAVNGFVLEVQLPGNDPAADRGQGPPRQIAVEIRGHEPRPIDDKSETHRRPFHPTGQRRQVNDIHGDGPQLTRGKSPQLESMIRPNPAPATIILLLSPNSIDIMSSSPAGFAVRGGERSWLELAVKQAGGIHRARQRDAAGRR